MDFLEEYRARPVPRDGVRAGDEVCRGVGAGPALQTDISVGRHYWKSETTLRNCSFLRISR